MSLSPEHLSALARLQHLTSLELENVDHEDVLELLRLMGHQLVTVTLTNIIVNPGQVVSLVPRASTLHLKNTNVVLSDEVDEARQLPWSTPPDSLNIRSVQCLQYICNNNVSGWRS